MSAGILATMASVAQTGIEPISGPIGIEPISAPVDGAVPTPEITWAALLPLIILGLGGLLLLTLSSLLKRKAPRALYPIWTIATAVLAMASVVPVWAKVQGFNSILWWDFRDLWWQPATTAPGPFSTLGGAYGVDGFSLFVTVLICCAVILTTLLISDYLQREELDGPEPYALLLLAATGGVVMAGANDLIVLFLGLETISIAVYVLAASHLRRAQSQEAGLKYFILGGFSSAFFLYGIAMVYGATGTTNLVLIKSSLAESIPRHDLLLLVGFAMLLVGFGFKVAAVPFHSWSPDVYDGAPSPVVAFMASAVKVAGFAALVRVFVAGFGQYAADWQPLIYALAVLSLVVGSSLAIVQTNVKRTLAYSSISHAGFILIAVEAASETGTAAVLFYAAAYTFMVAGSFGVATLVGRAGDGRHSLDDYKGLGRTNPVLAGTLTIFLLAQAGVPFTVGFVAKFYAVIAAVQAGSAALGVVAMLSAVIAAFLYLRIIVAMYMAEGDDGGSDAPADPADHIHVPRPAAAALAICVLVTIGFGLFPGWLTDMAADSTVVLVEQGSTDASTALPGGQTLIVDDEGNLVPAGDGAVAPTEASDPSADPATGDGAVEAPQVQDPAAAEGTASVERP